MALPISTVFEAPKFPLQNISYFTPFGAEDVGTVASTVAALHQKVPGMADAWSKNGLVYLNGMALDTYHIWTKFPLTKIEDLQGKKIGAPGPAANWIKGTGAVAVAGTLNTYYEDIKSGVSDGAIVFSTGAWAAKLHEVAPYVTKVNFGAQFSGGLAVNKARFDGLSPDVQKALREASAEWSAAYARAQAAAAAGALENMGKAGAKITSLTDAERKRWADALPPVAKTWATDVQGKGLPANEVLNGYIAEINKAGAKPPRDWTK
jgi:TRAP-type transport system periplasmic protein